MPSLVRGALLVLEKDLRIERRTKEIVTTAAFFAALVVVLSAISFGAPSLSEVRAAIDAAEIPPAPRASIDLALARASAGARGQVAPGALWVSIAFASVLALTRTWIREREDGALVALLLSPISRASLFLGKATGVFLFLSAVEAVVVPLVALLFHVDLPAAAPALAIVLVAGTLGVAAAGTLFGAMTARTGARELVLASVLFPLLSPALLTSVGATRQIFLGDGVADLTDYFWLLGAYDAVAVLGGLAMFGALLD